MERVGGCTSPISKGPFYHSLYLAHHWSNKNSFPLPLPPSYTSFRHLMIHHSVVFYFFRDLSSVRAEVTKSVRVVQGACMDLDKNLRGMDANTQSALEEERARCQKVPDTFLSDSFDPLV